MENGVIYVCNNSKKHISELRYSIQSLKKHNHNLKTALFTNTNKNWTKCFDYVFSIDENHHPLKTKVSSLLKSPFYNTLYLDVDTAISADLSDLFSYLNKYEICLAKEPYIDYKKRPPEFISYEREDVFNTGLVLYKKTKPVINFLNIWKNEILNEENRRLVIGEWDDQFIFNKLIKSYEKDLGFLTIDNKIYNTRYWAYLNMSEDEQEKINIKHWHFMNRSKFSLKLEEYYIFVLRLLFKIDKEQVM